MRVNRAAACRLHTHNADIYPVCDVCALYRDKDERTDSTDGYRPHNFPTRIYYQDIFFSTKKELNKIENDTLGLWAFLLTFLRHASTTSKGLNPIETN